MKKIITLLFLLPVVSAFSISNAKPINPGPPLSSNAFVIANVSCNGGSNGSASAAPVGGTAPYTYLWNDGSSQTTDTAVALIAGSYTVTITDATSATVTASVTINQPNPLNNSAAPINNPT